MNIALRVLSRPVEEHLPEIFSKIGIDFDERVLPGVGNEVLKAVVVSVIHGNEVPSGCLLTLIPLLGSFDPTGAIQC